MNTSFTTAKVLEDLQREYHLEEVITFITQLAERYDFNPETLSKLESGLGLVQRKSEDKHLYLGVIGEASSGKSTLINSLLGMKLLGMNIIPGTTSASTIITYSDEIGIDVELLNGNLLSYPRDIDDFSAYNIVEGASDFDNVCAILVYTTTQENVSASIKAITVRVPSERLRTGLVIVDTPGINHDNERHFEVTTETIEHYCDAAIIVMPANAPLGMNLSNFLTKHLKSYLHRCLFVISKIDRIDAEDRDIVLTNVCKQITQVLGLTKPQVVPITVAFEMEKIGVKVGSKVHHKDALEQEELKKTFNFFVDSSLQLMAGKRLVIILERVFQTMELLLLKMEKELESLENHYLQEHDALQRSILARPEAMKNESLQNALAQYDFLVSKARASLGKDLLDQSNDVIYKTSSTINSFSSIKRIKADLEKSITNNFKEYENTLKLAIGSRQKELVQACEISVSVFQENFQKIYSKLATLGGKINEIGNYQSPQHRLRTIRSQSQDSISRITKLSNESIKEGEAKISMGVIGGIVLGIILPGIGVVLGGILGSVFGSMFGPSLADTKKKINDNVIEVVKSNYPEQKRMIFESFDNMSKELRTSLVAVIQDSYTDYNSLIRTMNVRDDKIKQTMLARTSSIRNDRELASQFLKNLEEGIKVLVNK